MAAVFADEIISNTGTKNLTPASALLHVRMAQVANWLPRPGKAKVTYAEGSTFEGVFNGERIKEGIGKYTWMKPAEEDGEDPQVRSVYTHPNALHPKSSSFGMLLVLEVDSCWGCGTDREPPDHKQAAFV